MGLPEEEHGRFCPLLGGVGEEPHPGQVRREAVRQGPGEGGEGEVHRNTSPGSFLSSASATSRNFSTAFSFMYRPGT